VNGFAPYIVILVSGTLGFSLLTASGIIYLRARKHKQRRKSSWSREHKSGWLWPKLATHRERKASIPKNRKGADFPAPRRGKGKPKTSHFPAGCSSKEQPRPRTQPGSMSREPVFQPHIELRPSSSDASSKPPALTTSFPIGQGLPNDSSEDDGILPSGYTRSEYHRCGATDADIKFWGLDQPGAPPPRAAGWVIGDVIDKMKQDGW